MTESSPNHTDSTEFPESLSLSLSLSLSPSVSIAFRSWEILSTESSACTELTSVSSRLTLARPCVGVHWRPSLLRSKMSCSSWMVGEIGSKWSYICCFVECCFKDSLKTAFLCSSSVFFLVFVRVQVVHPHSSIDTVTVWRKSRFILSDQIFRFRTCQ